MAIAAEVARVSGWRSRQKGNTCLIGARIIRHYTTPEPLPFTDFTLRTMLDDTEAYIKRVKKEYDL